MREFISKFWCASLCFALVACDVSITPGGIEDRNAPKEIENLAPIPDGYLEFAYETTRLFFEDGRAGIEDRLHPLMADVTKTTWSTLENYASDNPDFQSAEYYGHGFGEHQGVELVVIRHKVPFEGGYNLVNVTMPTTEACCRVAGFEVNLEIVKSFKLGGK